MVAWKQYFFDLTEISGIVGCTCCCVAVLCGLLLTNRTRSLGINLVMEVCCVVVVVLIGVVLLRCKVLL